MLVQNLQQVHYLNSIFVVVTPACASLMQILVNILKSLEKDSSCVEYDDVQVVALYNFYSPVCYLSNVEALSLRTLYTGQW